MCVVCMTLNTDCIFEDVVTEALVYADFDAVLNIEGIWELRFLVCMSFMCVFVYLCVM